MGRCMDSANYNGHRGWNSAVAKNNRNSNWDDSNAREDIDKPWYLENLGEDHSFTGTAYAGQDVSGSAKDTDAGFICGPNALADGEWFKCGTHYTVKGLMNTYDEFAQQEYGTMQEFWFQFHYHYVFDTTQEMIVMPISIEIVLSMLVKLMSPEVPMLMDQPVTITDTTSQIFFSMPSMLSMYPCSVMLLHPKQE